MQFDKQGRRITSYGQMSMLIPKKRGRGRPRKLETAILEKIATSKPANVSQLVPKKRGRGRPRKYPAESENEATIKLNYIAGVKEKLKLLETIVSSYKEIERIDKETLKNVDKFCALVHNSK